MADYATGDKALGICDRCGFEYLLHELKTEVINLFDTDLKVCPNCWDPDQPQNMLGRFPVSDPQALRGARPDTGAPASRSLPGFDPVRGMVARGILGNAVGV